MKMFDCTHLCNDEDNTCGLLCVWSPPIESLVVCWQLAEKDGDRMAWGERTLKEGGFRDWHRAHACGEKDEEIVMWAHRTLKEGGFSE